MNACSLIQDIMKLNISYYFYIISKRFSEIEAIKQIPGQQALHCFT